jgi:hypothetical protein
VWCWSCSIDDEIPDHDKMPGIVVASCSEFWYFRDQLNVALSRLLTEVVISSLVNTTLFVAWKCFSWCNVVMVWY